jgi:hypothetical protein
MTDFSIPQDTLLPILTATLTDDTGPINLTGATVKFQMRLPGSTVLKVNTNAQIVAAVAGQVSYSWQATDTDTPGVYIGWFLVTYGAAPLMAPNPQLVVEVGRGAG